MSEQSKKALMKRISATVCLALLISVIMSGCASGITGTTNVKYGKYQGLFKNCVSSSADYQAYSYIKIENNEAKFWTEIAINGVHAGDEFNAIMYELITQGNEVYMQNCETGDLTWRLETQGDQLITYHKSDNYVNDDAVYEKIRE